MKTITKPRKKVLFGTIIKTPYIRLAATEESPIAGYGRCSSKCGCIGYISKHDGSHECKKCNHHFSQHYD